MSFFLTPGPDSLYLRNLVILNSFFTAVKCKSSQMPFEGFTTQKCPPEGLGSHSNVTMEEDRVIGAQSLHEKVAGEL